MEMSTKKYISPGGWFSLRYPETWNEFEDEEGSFLFYNPEKWVGNFRISVFKDTSLSYANEVLADERKWNTSAQDVKVGSWECVYSCENFTESGEDYVTHLWMTGSLDTVAECSFSTLPGAPKELAESIIASLELRDQKKQYPKECIPIRVLEINEVNEAFEWATSQIKKNLKKDFSSVEQDIERIQQMINNNEYTSNQKDVWMAFGIAFGTILVNEIDGMDWVTVMDGRQEYPALRFRQTKVVVDLRNLIYERLRSGGRCDLRKEYIRIKAEVEAVL